jgi:hypothetical protein
MPPEDEDDSNSEDILRVMLDLWWTPAPVYYRAGIVSARARTKPTASPWC